MPTDPAGLLQRIPELQPLCQDARINKAVEAGDPFKVYRALWWAKVFNRIPDQREILKSLLAQRRLFARPIKKAPTMYTLNSLGATILGSSDKNPDGTYIATHYIVAFFVLPLLPLGAYVVAPGQKARSYSFFARVPLGAPQWIWSRFWALGVIVAVALGAVRAGYSVGHHDLHIVNAFDKPVQAQIGEQTVTVPANSRTMVTLPVGQYKARARVAGNAVPLDDADLQIASDSSLAIWNIAGAAPLFMDSVIYSSDSSYKPPEPKPLIYCGQKYLTLRNVDDEFKDPPKEVEMSEGTKQLTRNYVDVLGAKGADAKISATICYGYLFAQGKAQQALTIQAAEARADAWPTTTTTSLLALQGTADPVLADRLAVEAAAAQPDDMEIQRAAQSARMAAGHETEVLAEYKKRAAAAPDSASAQYLYARLLDGPEGLAATERLVKRFPKDPALLRLAVYERATAGDWAGSDLAWLDLQHVKPDDATSTLDLDAVDLVALGRAKDAEARIAEAFPSLGSGSKEQQDLAETYARLAMINRERNPDRLLQQAEAKDSPATLARIRLGLPVEPVKAETPLLQLVRAARTDPKEAIAASTKLEVLDFFDLDAATWALTFAEAARTGAKAAETSLARYFHGQSKSRIDQLTRFVRGEGVVVPPGLDPNVHAAALFVRSRNTRLDAKERTALVAQARHLDWLHTSVSSAIDSWPQPIAAR